MDLLYICYIHMSYIYICIHIYIFLLHVYIFAFLTHSIYVYQVARRVGAAFAVPSARVAHLLDVSKPAMSSSGGTVRVGRVLLAHAIAGGARQGAAELAKERSTTLSETLISMQVIFLFFFTTLE